MRTVQGKTIRLRAFSQFIKPGIVAAGLFLRNLIILPFLQGFLLEDRIERSARIGVSFRFAAKSKKKETDMRFHGVRHTHATLMLSNGVDAKTSQVRPEHSSADATMS